MLNVNYRVLIIDDCEQIKDMNPSQYIERAWREVDGKRQLININYQDNAWPNGYEHHFTNLKETILNDAYAVGAFDEINNGFRVILKKSIQHGGQFDGLEINDRQQRACQYINKKGKITNREYREINNVKPRLALSELQDMVDKSILAQVGTTGRGTYYIFK